MPAQFDDVEINGFRLRGWFAQVFLGLGIGALIGVAMIGFGWL